MRSTFAVLVALLAAAPLAAQSKLAPPITRDADRDGVPDMRDRCAGTPPLTPVNANGCPTGPPAARAETALVAVPEPPTQEAERTQAGIGVALGGGSSTLLVPIVTASGIRVEPLVSFVETQSGSTPASTGNSTTSIRIGASVTRLLRPGLRSTRMWLGPRAGLGRLRTTASFGSAPQRVTAIDWFVGGVVGGELLLSPHFSLGGEAQLTYTRTGAFKADDGTELLGSGHQVGTLGQAAVRFYF